MLYEVITRCGNYCKGGGPALHTEDAPLLGSSLAYSDLVTLRAGEPAFDHVITSYSIHYTKLYDSLTVFPP